MVTQINKILVSVTDQATAESIKGILKNEKFSVSYAQNFHETIYMTLHDNFDLIVLDTENTDMVAFQSCRMIRANQKTREIPVIFLTSLDKMVINKCLECGGDDYIIKPLNHLEVIDKIKTRLSLKGTNYEYSEKNEDEQQTLSRLTYKIEKMYRELGALKEKNNSLISTSGKFLALENQKNNLLRIICHELRTPVSGIIGFTEIMNENPNCPENDEILKTMMFALTNMKDHVENAIMLSLIDPAQTYENMRPTKPGSLVEYVLSDFLHSFEKKGISVKTDLKIALLETNIDSGLIEDVLRIVLNHSVMLSPANGIIEIKVTEKNNCIELSISNKGKGFEIEKLNRLNAVFKKDSFSRHSDCPDMHFGIIKLIMDIHNAQVQIENNENGDAQVKLIFKANILQSNTSYSILSSFN